MTETDFRHIPSPRYPEDEMSAEPRYSVLPEDVLSEEFRYWLCADPCIGPLFEEIRADLFSANYQHGLQTHIKDNHMGDVYAYRRRQRFSVRYRTERRPNKAFAPPSGSVRRA